MVFPNKMGLNYWNIAIDITSGTLTLPENGKNIEHHCLLVPELTNSGLPLPQSDPIFAIIDSQWCDVVPDPVTGTPTIKKAKRSDS